MSESKLTPGADQNLSADQTNTRFDLRAWLHEIFDLNADKAKEREVIEDIRKGVEFKGTNVWILIFAIMVASVGLNKNSAAVIIGAMLISPLMGPIMGVGLGVGINDFKLIIKSLKNLALMAGISIGVSFLYFLVSPQLQDPSELLSRTSPDVWDVLIATFGGLAGIVATSRKEKSNVVPGVAIATALMPPLCTAGFGLANGNWFHFLGAFYLFIINSVFISLSTYALVKFMDYPTKEFMNRDRERRVKRYIAAFAILVILPSAWTAFRLVRESVVQQNISSFIQNEMDFRNSSVTTTEPIINDSVKVIRVFLLGQYVSEEKIDLIREKLPKYGLSEFRLQVVQSRTDGSEYMAKIEELAEKQELSNMEYYKKLLEDRKVEMEHQSDSIRVLRSALARYQDLYVPSEEISKELSALNKNVSAFSCTKTAISYPGDSVKIDTVHLAYLKFIKKPKRSEIKQLEDFLKVRTKADSLQLVY